MKEFIDKLISRLEEIKSDNFASAVLNEPYSMGICHTIEKSIEIVNQLAEEYRQDLDKNSQGWIPCNDQLPPHSDDLLLVQCSGKPRNNISLVNAFCLASYTEEGWILEMYPDWKDAKVMAWKNLGEPYQPKGE